MSYSFLRRHSVLQHNMNHVKVTDKRVVVEARYHRCHICRCVILCDNRVLSNHVLNKHHITLLEYQRHHVIKNGARVFPTLQDYKNNSNVFEDFKILVQEHNQTLGNDKDEDENGTDGYIQPHMLSSESEDSDCGK